MRDFTFLKFFALLISVGGASDFVGKNSKRETDLRIQKKSSFSLLFEVITGGGEEDTGF
jgi:hypothetical protein